MLKLNSVDRPKNVILRSAERVTVADALSGPHAARNSFVSLSDVHDDDIMAVQIEALVQ